MIGWCIELSLWGRVEVIQNKLCECLVKAVRCGFVTCHVISGRIVWEDLKILAFKTWNFISTNLFSTQYESFICS